MRISRTLLIFAVAMLTAGCSIYHPQAVDIPLLQEKGETRIDGSIDLSVVPFISGPHINGTVSHAFTDHFAAQGHANIGPASGYLQAAAGGYLPVGERFVVEGFGGLGFGGTLETGDYNKTLDGNPIAYGGRFLMPYLQIDAGWRHLWIFEVGVGLKGGLMLPSFYYNELDPKDNSIVLTHFDYASPNWVLEPALQLRVGSRNVMFTVRLGTTYLSHLYNAPSEQKGNLTFDFFTISTGLNFTL